MVLISLPVGAQQVFKCVKGKEVSYQSEPCDVDRVAEKAWDAGRYAPPSNAELWRVHNTIEATSRRDAQLRGNGGGSGSGASVQSSVGRCEGARRARDKAIYDAGPGNVSVKSRRAWDAHVAAQCK